MVPGLLCFLKLEETHSRVHPRFPLPLPHPCPSAVDGFSRFLLSLTASLLFVSPSPLLPHSPREGSYSQLPWGGWRAPPIPLCPCHSPFRWPPQAPGSEAARMSLLDSGGLGRAELVPGGLSPVGPAAGVAMGVFAPILSNLYVKGQPCLALRGQRGPSLLGELHL